MSSSSMLCELARVAIAAIALQISINEGGGKIATLNGARIRISPDNIQGRVRRLPKMRKHNLLKFLL